MPILKSLAQGFGVVLLGLLGVVFIGFLGFIPVYFFGLKGVIAWPFILLVLGNAAYFYNRGKTKA